MDCRQGLRAGKVRKVDNTLVFIKLKDTTKSENEPDHKTGCRPHLNQNHIEVRRSFVQEGADYNIFSSYRKEDACVPVWKLTKKERAELLEQYFISADVRPEEVTDKLKGFLKTNMDTLEKGEGYEFCIPNLTEENMRYDRKVGINLLLKGKMKTRSFGNKNQRYLATLTAATIPKVLDNMADELRFSKRMVYYTDMDLYGSQERSDAVLTDICCMTGSRLANLNVVPAGTGIILGNVVMNFRNAFPVSCSTGALIPNPKNIESIDVHEGVGEIRYVLLLEKITMMVYLSNFNYHKVNQCLLVCGAGMPSIDTREFLRFLKEHTGLPIYGLSDPDPEGAEIMSVYARGSVLSGYDNFNISVPAIRWIGLTSSDLADNNLELPESCYLPFSDNDEKTLKSISNSNLSDEWQHRIDHMMHFKKKTSFEDLQKIGARYLARILLPAMIQNASENKKANISEGTKDKDGPSSGGADDIAENNGQSVTDGKKRSKRPETASGDVPVGTLSLSKKLRRSRDFDEGRLQKSKVPGSPNPANTTLVATAGDVRRSERVRLQKSKAPASPNPANTTLVATAGETASGDVPVGTLSSRKKLRRSREFAEGRLLKSKVPGSPNPANTTLVATAGDVRRSERLRLQKSKAPASPNPANTTLVATAGEMSLS